MEVLEDINFSFTIIFLVEMVIKILGLGPVNYVRDYMNCFDGTIVIISIVEL